MEPLGAALGRRLHSPAVQHREKRRMLARKLGTASALLPRPLAGSLTSVKREPELIRK